MNIKNTFITDDNLKISRWSMAFPDAEIISTTQFEPQFHQSDVVWIVVGIENWQSLISDYTQLGIPVIALSKRMTLAELRQALELGARAYVEALANVNTLKQVAETVTNGAMWLPAPLLTRIIGSLSNILPEPNSFQKSPLEILTQRERQVTEAVAQGASNKEVAKQLNITERTVKAHLTSIYEKLQVKDRMHLMLIARVGP
ncbi:DNA-binding response regulator [Nitrincola tibetensis]|uniref:DNA-binding response regulator n=1 Tax=Nitrincola tibetensis TaxID=2219697 RepID=A0A364NMS5_9GAMM|nr:response regulator transcription factor [Nitrincola tibetensis]RAU18409.1 DNA-binding response regulator [Nitrincola tibetensis]